MTMQADFRLDQKPWLLTVAEIDALVAKLPDGAQRRSAFERDMRFCEREDDYLEKTPVAESGLAIMRMGPGPKALAFLEELRAIVRQAGAA